MDDPKKPSNDPVSSGSKETTESKIPDTAPGEKPGIADEQDISPSGISDDSAEPEKADAESLDNENPETNGDSTGQSAEETSDLEIDPEIMDESPEIIGDKDEPYHDPYDTDDIYGDYNDEHYEESDYASEPEQMPERPDDPHIEETASSPDRAGEEEVAPGIVKKSGADSSKNKKDEPADDDEDKDSIEEGERELGGRMSFLDHLDELRKRIFHANCICPITNEIIKTPSALISLWN